MLSTAKAYLENLSTWLVLLKYFGLCLAAGSSIWGTVNDLTVKTADGKKQLTGAGIVAISFTILGLITGLVADDLQRRDADATHKAQILAEAKRTNEIIIAGQQLASLSLHWQFASASAALWQTMAKGQKEITENSKSSQGGSPEVPFEVKEYDAALLPLISYVAQTARKASNAKQSDDSAKDRSIVVLITLDASPNAILSFGAIETRVSWYESRDAPLLSAGFAQSQGTRPGNSTPHVTVDLANSNLGMSNYAIDWDLDPSTLAGTVDRRNPVIYPTAKLPPILKVAIFHDVHVLPFQKNNFGLPYANVWNYNDWAREDITPPEADLNNMIITVEVNGYPELKYIYYLKTMYKLTLTDNLDDEISTGCTILEFQVR